MHRSSASRNTEQDSAMKSAKRIVIRVNERNKKDSNAQINPNLRTMIKEESPGIGIPL